VMAGPDGSVVIPTLIRSGHPQPAHALPEVARRFGIDRSPLDVQEARDARWLQACIWPSDGERHERLAGAIALGRSSALDLRRGDANEMLIDVLADLDRDIRPVVFHSWVVSYFDGDARRRFADTVRAMVVEHDGAWISAEGPNVVPGLAAPALPDDAGATLREATVWHLTTCENGVATNRAIARSQAHCRWIEWLAD
jgi:hypothetical protein